MSNRDCFSIFLSRALSLLRPGGRGFVAVYPPTTRLFRGLAGDMQLPIATWHAEHNHYYSHFGNVHYYSSDWVEVAPDLHTKVLVGAAEQCEPFDLYREDVFGRPRLALMSLEDIDDVRFATASYLNTIVDVLADQAGLFWRDRHTLVADNWAAVLDAQADGFVALSANRASREISFTLYPHTGTGEEVARNLLVSAYKRRASKAHISTVRGDWDLRIR